MSDHLVALKNEQTARIVMRDTSLYVFIATIFAVYAAEGQAGQNLDLINLIRTCSTALSAIMFSIYLSNDFYVSKIGQFVAADPTGDRFKAWEAFHRKGWGHHAQKLFRTVVVVILFGGWPIYEGHLLVQSSNALAQLAAGVFGVIVLAQVGMFLALSLTPQRSAGTAKHAD